MADKNRRKGIISLNAGSAKKLDTLGDFEYHTGGILRKTVIGSDSVHGYEEEIIGPYIEGEISDGANISIEQLKNQTDETIILNLFEDRNGPGKVITLSGAWWAGEGKGSSNGKIPVRWESRTADEKTS
jgi:hypothetical protein